MKQCLKLLDLGSKVVVFVVGLFWESTALRVRGFRVMGLWRVTKGLERNGVLGFGVGFSVLGRVVDCERG